MQPHDPHSEKYEGHGGQNGKVDQRRAEHDPHKARSHFETARELHHHYLFVHSPTVDELRMDPGYTGAHGHKGFGNSGREEGWNRSSTLLHGSRRSDFVA